MKIPIEISARHIHLSQKDLEKLFGKGYKLSKLKNLSQTGEFATREKVVLVKNKEFDFRIIGPIRKYSQIEISSSEARELKIKAPLRLSGDLKNVTAKLDVIGPKGKVKVKIIRAKRHLHCTPQDAKKLKIKNNQKIKIDVNDVIFENVLVRVNKKFKLTCHLDIDEANAANMEKKKVFGKIVK